MRWNLIESALAFSTFSAVLAAFMFAAIVLLLTRELKKDVTGELKPDLEVDLISRPITLMLSALFSLVIAAFLFSAMTGNGDKGDAGQFVEGTMPCIVLSFGVVEMSAALTSLFRIRNLMGPPLELAGYVVDATIGIVAVFLPGVFLSASFQRLPGTGLPLDPPSMWIVMVAVLLLAIPVGRLARLHLKPSTHKKSDPTGLLLLRVVTLASLFGSVLAAILWNILSSTDEGSLAAVYSYPVGTALTIVVLLIVAAMFAALEAVSTGDVRIRSRRHKTQS